PERYAAACRIAEAQIDVTCVRNARWQLIAELERHLETEDFEPRAGFDRALARLVAIDRYERSARARRTRAIRAFSDLGLPVRTVRQRCRTKPLSDSALLRMAGWRDPFACYLRGYPGLPRAFSP